MKNKEISKFIALTVIIALCALCTIVFSGLIWDSVLQPFPWVEGKDATCTEDGYKGHYEDPRTGLFYADPEGEQKLLHADVIIPKLGHSPKHYEAKEATCEETGNVEYWKCTRCSVCFSDAQCNNVVEETDLFMSGHTYNAVLNPGEWKWSADKSEALFIYTCTTCSKVQEIPAKVTQNVVVVPTCVDGGEKTYTATVKIGQKYYSSEQSDVLNATNEHKYRVDSTEATDTEAGYTTYTCETCGYRYTTNIDPFISFTLADDENSYGISLCTLCQNGSITIPRTYKNLPVTSIHAGAFSDNTYITSITIPNCVINIGEKAFENCVNIKSATIPTWAIEYIPKTNLETVEINGGTEIPSHAFSNCSKLKSVVIPDSVTKIGSFVFDGCGKLSKIKFQGTFKQWTAIKKSSSWKNDDLTIIVACRDDFTFELAADDKILYRVCYVSGLIVLIVFSYFIRARRHTCIISKGTTSLGDYAFSNRKYEIIIIPNQVTHISNSAFCGCDDITKIKVKEGNPTYHSADNCLIETQTNTLILGCRKSTIPSYVTSIQENAFYKREWFLKKCIIPKGVTIIGRKAFFGCELSRISISSSVTKIEQEAFSDCVQLYEIKYEGTIAQWKAIDKGYDWNHKVPARNVICSDGEVALLELAEGNQETPENSKTPIKATIDNYDHALFNIDKEKGTLVEFKAKSYSGVVEIPYGVTTINKSAFEKCKTITGVIIPESVLTIGSYAFSGCSNLTSIIIPNSVTSIGDSAFDGCIRLRCNKYSNALYLGNESNLYLVLVEFEPGSDKECSIHYKTRFIHSNAFFDCKNLTEITIPGNVRSLGAFLFLECRNLKEITIPSSVTSLGKFAFSGCGKLSRIKFNGTIAQWNAIQKGISWNFDVPAQKVICSDGEVLI